MSDQIIYVGATDADYEEMFGPEAQVKDNFGYSSERSGTRFLPIRDGLYDPRIFGTTARTCVCGRQRVEGRCPRCKQIIVRNVDKWIELVGYYRLCVPYVSDIKFKKLRETCQSLLNINILQNKKLYDLIDIGVVWSSEFNVIGCSPEEATVIDRSTGSYGKVVVNDSTEQSNIFDCGLFGLSRIAEVYEGTKGNLGKILEYVNFIVPIAPVALRPMSIGFNGAPSYPELSGDYSMLIEMNKKIEPLIFDRDSTNKTKLIDKLALASTINLQVDNIIKTYPILKGSKESWIRYANTGRVSHSGRCNIISAECGMNEILIPLSLAYEAIQDDIEEALRNRFEGTGENIKDMYKVGRTEAIELCKEIINDSVVVINRAPTLHRYNMLAFKAKIWDENEAIGQHPDKVSTMGMNSMVCAPFNADFDGDTMAFYIFTKDPQKSKIYDTMGIENNWFYEKNADPIFVPNDTVLMGLHAATNIKLPSDLDSIPEIIDYDELQFQYNNYLINADTVVNLGTKENPDYTTFGIEKMGEILQVPLMNVLGVNSKLKCCIKVSNVAKISIRLGSYDNKIGIMNEIFKYGNEWALRHGTKLLRINEIMDMVPEFPEVQEIIDSDKPEMQKYIELCEKMPDIIRENIKKYMPSLDDDMSSGAASVKGASLTAIFSPQVTFTNGVVEVSPESLNSGLSTEAMVHHLSTNREILHQKANLVPTGGYLTRQVVDLERDYIYKSQLYSTDKIGIEVPKSDAFGRIRVEDGSEVGRPINDSDKNTLVRIKSSIYTPNVGMEKFYIKSDELNRNLYITKDNSAVGMSVAMSTTEAITQAQLGLKHGGSLLTPAGADKKELFRLTADDDYEVVEKDEFHIVLGKGLDRKWYPVPINHVYTKEVEDGHVKKGDVIYYLDEMHYVDFKIKRIIDVIGANKSSGSGEFNIYSKRYDGSECFSIEGGKIHYDIGRRSVIIGKQRISYANNVVYKYPEGAEVPPYTQFCTGSLNPKIIRRMTKSHEKRFYLFYYQMKALVPTIQLLSVELLFRSLFNFGHGTIQSSIRAMDPIIAMGHEKATASIKQIIDVTLDPTLGLALTLNQGDRSIC